MTGQAGAAQTVLYKNRLLDKADKYLFLAAFVFGAISIIGLKILQARQLYVTAVPVTVMTVYGLYIILSPRYRLRDDRAGDSLYYLGFLFTMVSLAYSLYEFGTKESGPRSIVTNFGIALATTIMGLMLRVLYHQFRQDPFDVERQVQLELSDAADKLKGEIHETMIGFASLRLGIVQSLNEAKNNVAISINAVAEDTAAKYKSAIDDVSGAASGAASKLTSTVTALAGGIDNLTRQVTISTSAVDKAAGSLSTTLTEQDRALRNHTQNLVSSFESLVKRIKEVDVPSDLLKRPIQTTLDRLDTEINTVLNKIEAEQSRIASLIKATEKSAGSSAALSDEIAQLQKEAAAQRELIRNTMADLKRTFESVGSTASSLLSTEDKNLQEHKRILQQLQTDTAATLNTVQQYRERLIAEVQQSSDMLTQVHKSLVSLTRTIVDQVGGRRP